jgi:hypothetical protein
MIKESQIESIVAAVEREWNYYIGSAMRQAITQRILRLVSKTHEWREPTMEGQPCWMRVFVGGRWGAWMIREYFERPGLRNKHEFVLANHPIGLPPPADWQPKEQTVETVADIEKELGGKAIFDSHDQFDLTKEVVRDLFARLRAAIAREAWIPIDSLPCKSNVILCFINGDVAEGEKLSDGTYYTYRWSATRTDAIGYQPLPTWGGPKAKEG